MKILRSPYFILLIILYLLVKYLKINEVELPLFFKYYFTDLLFMPIVLMLCLALIRWIKQQKSITLSPLIILSLTVGYSIFFEWYAPLISANQTGDWIDVLMYVLGGTGFWLIQKNLSKLELNRQFKG